jgi:ABC-type transporter Mla subunit MlaD
MHNFDPYEELLRLQHKIVTIEGSIQQIAIAFNDRSNLLQQIVDNQTKLIDQLNLQDQQLNMMHNRIRLLEAARQHENKN